MRIVTFHGDKPYKGTVKLIVQPAVLQRIGDGVHFFHQRLQLPDDVVGHRLHRGPGQEGLQLPADRHELLQFVFMEGRHPGPDVRGVFHETFRFQAAQRLSYRDWAGAESRAS